MNPAFRRSLQLCVTPVYHQLASGGGAFPRLGSVNTDVPSRSIKKWVKEYKYQLRARRAKEQFRFPERYAKPQPRSGYSDWNYKAELFAFGSRLGEKFDDALLREALTDDSYIHQERKKQEELGISSEALNIQSNQELSQLGHQLAEDVLYAFVRKEVPLFPDAGHAALVNHLTSLETMSKVASNLGLKDLILCEEYPPSDETFSRAMFAVIGGLQKSSGEERAEKFVIDFLASLLCGKDLNELWDIPRPWALMTQLAQQRDLLPVEPRLMHQTGVNTIHAAFVVGVYDKNKTLLGSGIGETLDIAQEMAARDVLKGFFNTREPRSPFQFQAANIPFKLVPHGESATESAAGENMNADEFAAVGIIKNNSILLTLPNISSPENESEASEEKLGESYCFSDAVVQANPVSGTEATTESPRERETARSGEQQSFPVPSSHQIDVCQKPVTELQDVYELLLQLPRFSHSSWSGFHCPSSQTSKAPSTSATTTASRRHRKYPGKCQKVNTFRNKAEDEAQLEEVREQILDPQSPSRQPVKMHSINLYQNILPSALFRMQK